MPNRTIKQEMFSSHDDALSTLAAAFPEVVKDGEVDWDALKAIFKDAPFTGPEKYELTWAGKAEAKREAERDVVGRTLRFFPEESKDAETTRNLYIEGDNLEVLKLLRGNYYGAVKMIYIDPPYNTGSDFVYRDNFSQSGAESELAEGNIDSDGNRLIKNPRSSNRYHAAWLSMLYPRLRLARDLLSSDGMIFISIDDNEAHHLRNLCDEVFGENNFVATYIWKARSGKDHTAVYASVSQEYVLCYSRNKYEVNVGKDIRERSGGNYHDEKGSYKREQLRQWGTNDRKEDRPTMYYPVIAPDGSSVYPVRSDGTPGCWRISDERMKALIEQGDVDYIQEDGQWRLYAKQRDGAITKTAISTLIDDAGTSATGTLQLKELFGQKVFPTTKPIDLVLKLMQIADVKNSDLILDFFSGSGTTAHAVFQANSENSWELNFICIQISESLTEESEAAREGFYSIFEVGRERIKRAGDKIFSVNSQRQEGLFNNKRESDIGFKVLKASDTVIRWTHDALRSGKQMTLDEAAMSDKDRLDFMPGFTDIDVVYEIALRQNDVPLSAPVRPVPEAGKRTYLFADSILVCLEESITPELVEALAALQPTPSKFVLRDSAFEDNIVLKDETLRRLQACVARNTKDAKPTYVVDFI